MDRSIILKNATQYNIHGEAASAPLQNLEAMREDHHQILKNYDPKESIVMNWVFFGRCGLVIQYLMVRLLDTKRSTIV